MSIFDGIFGGGDDQEVEIKLPGWAEEYATDLAGFKGQGLRDARQIYEMMRTYAPYGGQRLADFSGDTNTGFRGLRQAPQRWRPGMNQAQHAASRDPTVYGNRSALRQLTNPHQETVINRTVADIEESGNRRRMADNSRYSRLGAHGMSGRQGVTDAMRERDIDDTIGDTVANLRQTGHDRATETLGRDLDRRITGAGSLADIMRMRGGMEREAAGDLIRVGGMQEGRDQQSLDLAYEDFERQRDHPMTAYNFWNAATNDQPFNPAQYAGQRTSGGGGNWFNQIAGLGLAGIGAWNM